MKHKILGVVLAGGKSTRMGDDDKALMKYSVGACLVPMIKHAVDRLRNQIEDVVVNTNASPSDFLKGADVDVVIIPDSFKGYAGPLAGVLAGLEYAQRNGFDRIVTVSVDTPFYPNDLVERLIIRDVKIIISKSTTGEKGRNLQPAFGVWNVALLNDLKMALEDGTRKVMAFVEQHDWATCEWNTQEFDYFFNVNTPQDLITANKMFSKQVVTD